MAGAEGTLLVFLQLLVTLTLGSAGRGAIQFRISEAEFSKVAGVLLTSPEKYITYNEECNVVDQSLNYSVSFKNLKVDESVPTIVNITIPKDDHIRAVTTFTGMTISTSLNRTSKTNPQGEPFELSVRLKEVCISAEGQVESVTGQGLGVTLVVPECKVLSLIVDTESLDESVAQEFSSSHLESLLKQMICETYQLQFSLGFDGGEVDLQLDIFNIFAATKAVNLQIKNSTIIVTKMLQFSFEENDHPSYHTMTGVHEAIAYFPPLRENSHPFEIWLNSDLIGEFWEFYKKGRDIGEGDIGLQELFPILPYANIGSCCVPYLPQLYTTYPEATVNLQLSDADVTANITEGSMQMNLNLTGYVEVALDCDPTRKYSAFNFSMLAHIPTQVAPKNSAVTFRFHGFGGNVTVLSSSIGHIKSRHLSVLFYSLPQIKDPATVFKDVNDRIKGVSMKKLLPNNLFVKDLSTSLVKDHIVMGGRLSSKDPKLPPRDSLDWVGDISMALDLIFPLFDNTAEDLEPLEEQNCDPPKITSAGESHMIQQYTPVILISVLTLSLSMTS